MITESVQKTYDELSQKINKIEKYLENTPEGYLKVRDRNHKYSYFHKTKNEKGEWQTRHLRQTNSKDLTTISKLTYKQYYKKILPIIKKELSVLEKFLKEYNPETKYQVYDSLCDGRKAILTPAFQKEEDVITQYVEKWKQEGWEQNKKYPEKLIHDTERGELVRSKSEILIANLLYQNEDKCIYRYEAATYINGMIIYPDFTIMKISTGEIYYWEHFGMMDDEDYANKTIQIKIVKELIKEYFD